ncbi:MAG: PadR family transcriptional regulator [Deltaproteobacteria bacterium]|nr:PadR family transcriptional regulator [Candidatus Zymogenaceae bacterium]
MARTNKTKYALLGMLTIAPMSGYDIKKVTEFSIGNFWSENYGHIYPMLNKMAREGLAKKHVEAGEGRPSRHVYEITEKGREELREWLTQPMERSPIRNEMLLRLFFGGQAPVGHLIVMIEQQRKAIIWRLETLDRIAAGAEKIPDGDHPLEMVFMGMTLDFGRRMAREAIQWCDDTLVKLRDMKEQEGDS